MTESRADRNAETLVLVGFAATVVAAIGLAIVYWGGGDPQVEGLLLGIAFAGLAVGLVTWAHRLLPAGPYEEPRPELHTTAAAREELMADFEREGVVSRRRLLLGGLGAAVGALGIAALFPIRSLGPAPGHSLERTPWHRGSRAVTEDGTPVRADAVPLGGLVTIFPDGSPGSADGQAVLVRVERHLLHGPRGGHGWAPGGLLAFSKVCTHAGCPVGLYQAQTHQLLCPCHQSAFDVLRGAEPVSGPAARALPQLPLEVDAHGVVRARGDFPEPIGPSYWNRP